MTPVGRLLFLLFALVLLAEFYLLLLLGRLVGFWPTVALVIGTAVLGASLAKREGLRVFSEYRTTISQGRMPEEGLLEAVLILLGGLLLIVPGVLTDLMGLCLLFPPTRRFVAQKVRSRSSVSTGPQKGTIRVMSFGTTGGVTPEPPHPNAERWREAAKRREKRTAETDAEIVDVEGPANR